MADTGRLGHCDRPPRGYYCMRPWGHEGPCPAYPRWWWSVWVYVRYGLRT